MENSIRLTIEILFSDNNNKPISEVDQKIIAEKVLNSLVNEVDKGSGLVPDESEYTTAHIYVNDYMTGGREYRFVQSF